MKAAAALALLFLSTTVNAQTSIGVAPPTWDSFNRLTLFHPAANIDKEVISVTPGDMLIEYWSKAGLKAPDAALLLTRDKFFASRGVQIAEGRPIEPLSAALVDYILVGRLLSKGVGGTPDSLKAAKKILVVENTKAIAVAIPGDRVVIRPPWRLEGEVAPDPQRRFRFTVSLSGAGQATLHLTGTVEMLRRLASDFSPSFPLVGWRAYKINPVQLLDATQEQTEYWPQPIPSVRNLAELRLYATQR